MLNAFIVRSKGQRGRSKDKIDWMAQQKSLFMFDWLFLHFASHRLGGNGNSHSPTHSISTTKFTILLPIMSCYYLLYWWTHTECLHESKNRKRTFFYYIFFLSRLNAQEAASIAFFSVQCAYSEQLKALENWKYWFTSYISSNVIWYATHMFDRTSVNWEKAL